ncbi:hypothetical protein [Kribbella lupini]|uniref:hypothetical protein n=1 Tax=Kribbella lupini TaxID=291602 RepID=UPI0031DAE3EE
MRVEVEELWFADDRGIGEQPDRRAAVWAVTDDIEAAVLALQRYPDTLMEVSSLQVA